LNTQFKLLLNSIWDNYLAVQLVEYPEVSHLR
jgi:hypothetical protein